MCLLDEPLSVEEFYKTFDKIEEGKATLAEMEVENGPAEWRNGKSKGTRKYHLASLESDKVALANLVNIEPRELSKALFVDLSKIAETMHAEHLYIALSRKSPQLANIIRSLTVYGFERVLPKELVGFTSSPGIMMLRFDLTAEEDFVDL